MCISERKLEIYEEMLKIEDSLYKLNEYTSLQDRAIYPTISTFSKRWTDVLNRYHSLNRNSFNRVFCSKTQENDEKEVKSG